MAWIKVHDEQDAPPAVAAVYQEWCDAHATTDVPAHLKHHSLSAATLAAFAQLEQALDQTPGPLKPYQSAMIATYVSRINHCRYGTAYHSEKLRAMQKAGVADWILNKQLHYLGARDRAMLLYAHKLTTDAAAVTAGDLDALRALEMDDAAILALCQRVAYTNLTNRMVLGLGAAPD